MIFVKVTYTVKDSYVPSNVQHINTFLEDFRNLQTGDFKYSVYTTGNTFVHLSQFDNETTQNAVLAVPSFKAFQQKRDDSGLVAAPQIAVLTPVGSTHQD
jgi:quinol monooxygenase YgiN